MIEMTGDLWDHWDQGKWVVVTTNGFVKKSGAAVLGAGIAKEAVQRFPGLPDALGRRLQSPYGNVPYMFRDWRIFTMPVKHRWDEDADPILIANSAGKLASLLNVVRRHMWPDQSIEVVSPRPGCGNGRLPWDLVRTLIDDPFTRENITIVDRVS